MPILLLSLVFWVSPLFSQFNAGRWAVRVDDAPVYKGESSTPVARLSYGAPIRARNQRQGRISFMSNTQEYWIDASNLIKMDVTVKNFSQENAGFIPAAIQNQKLSFVFHKALYALDITDLTNPHISKISDTPSVTGAYFSSDQSLLLLVGAIENCLNIALLSTKTQKFAPLTKLYGDVALVSAEFSSDNAYVALHIAVKDAQRILIFDVLTGELLSSVPDVQVFKWSENTILVAKQTSMDLVLPSGERKELYKSKAKEMQTVFAEAGGELLVDLDNKIYRFTNSILELTTYPSLERTAFLQRLETKGSTTVRYEKNTIRNLSGAKPIWDFVSFAGDKTLLYSAKSRTGAITTLYLYDAEANESYPYRWVEEPSQVLADGLAYEVVEDSDETWLFFEYPGSKVNILRLDDLLK
ncbi:MAG: hypothetical protein ACRC9L_07870 [Brevinema sp.]